LSKTPFTTSKTTASEVHIKAKRKKSMLMKPFFENVYKSESKKYKTSPTMLPKNKSCFGGTFPKSVCSKMMSCFYSEELGVETKNIDLKKRGSQEGNPIKMKFISEIPHHVFLPEQKNKSELPIYLMYF
jgi:hypothetical protein